jgi:fructosamine-3-kinase
VTSPAQQPGALSPDDVARLTRLLGAAPTAAKNLGDQHGAGHFRLMLADGREAFAKIQTNARNEAGRLSAARLAAAAGVPADQAAAFAADPGGYAAEAASLRWLAEAEAVPVPAVLASDEGCVVIEWLDSEQPSRAAASVFGRELARLHSFGAGRFGAAWPGVIAGLPLPNAQANTQPGAKADTWPEWYAANRVLPYVRIARDSGALDADQSQLIESAAARTPEVAGPPEPPSRIHGDCWAGNVLWSRSRGWLIDPAAHGGHRETDLAMLALFGAPHLPEIMAAYQDAAPLADGWRGRVPLHQLHPLLVHVCLFGSSYTGAALDAARAVLAL